MFERPDAKSARAQTPFDLLASTSDQPVVAISAPFSLGTHNHETPGATVKLQNPLRVAHKHCFAFV